MDLMQVVLVLVIVGMVMYAIERWVPMQANIKQILNVVVVVAVIIWLVSVFARHLLP